MFRTVEEMKNKEIAFCSIRALVYVGTKTYIDETALVYKNRSEVTPVRIQRIKNAVKVFRGTLPEEQIALEYPSDRFIPVLWD